MSEMRRTFVDENVNVVYDNQAKTKTDDKNDLRFLDNVDEGVSNVDMNRWQSAQKYEKKTWMELCRHTSDDRNYEHAGRFDNYDSLIAYVNENKITDMKMVELGCGPFTNSRVILEKIPDVNLNITLLDPLLNDYLNHPNCFYKSKMINGKLVETHSIPIEKFEQKENEYDILLMNNVIEHCYDVNLIFEKILSMLKPGGIIVFSDVYFYKKDMEELLEKRYDTGHPLKLSEKLINIFTNNFEVLYNEDFHGLYGESWRNDKYFIGTKK
tara:strand:+ start:2244 stop:3050 length:807 start_codon:yes stop_codon:yes gene_type:complete